MKNLLIGSRALEYWSNIFSVKQDADWDIISEHKITDDKKRIEIIHSIQLVTTIC